MSSGGGGGGKTEIRYASYIEENHKSFLDKVAEYRVATTDNSPYAGYVDLEVDDAFFGLGYTISSFPSLYDMYGKFMAGLDIENLYNQTLEDTTNSTVVNDLVAAEGALLDDDININSIPRMQVGMRDINSVMSSSYVIAKALIEDTRTKAISKFSAELKYRLLPMAQDRWSRHLEWNRGVVTTYMEVMKLYYVAKTDVDGAHYEYAEKNALWPFTVLDYERGAIGALQGAQTSKSTPIRGSFLSRLFGGMASGAAAGGMFGMPVIGGLAGGLGAILG